MLKYYTSIALDVLRLMVLHPHASDHYAVAHAKDQDDNLVDIVISYLLEDEVVAPNLIMTWRCVKYWGKKIS